MDSHIKERLVGAAVLVALGVWLIPWLLDGQDAPDGPPAGPDAQTSAIELPAPELPAPDTVATDTPLPDPAAPARPEPQTAAVDQSATEPGERSDAIAAGDGAGAIDTGPDTGLTAATAPDDPPADAAPATGAWAVQLGSFREPGNARQVAGRVADFGYEATVSDFEADSGTWHRVRIVGFATRAEADATGSALQAHGFDTTVLRAE